MVPHICMDRKASQTSYSAWGKKRGRHDDSNTSVSLAGTSLSSPILGSVVFDLTFLSEVTRQHGTIKDIHAQVIDSRIAVIIGRPIIRGNHLVRKIPLYFDQIPSSKPYLSQPVVPVTTPVTSRARCRGTESCDTCAPFVAQGYSVCKNMSISMIFTAKSQSIYTSISLLM